MKNQEEQRLVVDPPTNLLQEQKCLSHEGQLVHSYLVCRVKKIDIEKFKHTLLCTQCIYQLNLSAGQIDIIPQVMRDIKLKIQSTKTLIFYRKNQLAQAQTYFHRIQQGNRQIIQNKMKEHFTKLRDVMDKYEESCEQHLAELLKRQDEKIKAVQESIVGEVDKLFNADINLSSLEAHDDHEIIYMTNILDDQKKHLSENFKPNIEFNDISITLQLRESVYEKVENLLSSTSKLMMDELRQDGEPIRFMDILERDKNWQCPNCDNFLAKEIIYCEGCCIFRPLEMFKNLINDCHNVTDFELNFIESRRKMEKQLILDRDIQSQEEEEEQEEENLNDQEKKPYKKIWFMISGDWLFQWKCFISNKISNSSSISMETK